MALLFTIMLGISAGILGYFLHDFGRQDFLRETEAAIDAEISVLKIIAPNEPQKIIRYVNERSQGVAAVSFRYERDNGQWLAGSIKELPKNVQTLKEGVLRFSVETANKEQRWAAKIHTFSDGSRIMVARDINGLMVSYERLKHLSILIMLLMLVVVAVSFGISYFVVSRINRIACIAEHIIHTGDLSRRISIDTEWDDLSNLARVLNSFLMQIDSLMVGVREVSNNIAHDLRTPLTGLRNDIESLKGKMVTDDDLEGLLTEADRILSVFQSLLRIANIEKGKRHQIFQEVNLSMVLEDVLDLYEPLAEERDIKLTKQVEGKLLVKGDPDLLFQLFTNLLDNAIKFSNSASEISLVAKVVGSKLRVIIKDYGPGIPDSEKEQVFRHFYRGDKSRGSDGYGLGLSLVKVVVDKHHGEIALKDGKPGLEVWITLQPYQ